MDPSVADPLLSPMLQKGLLGAVAVYFAALAWRKDRQVKELYDRFLIKTETWLAKYDEVAREQDRTIDALVRERDKHER